MLHTPDLHSWTESLKYDVWIVSRWMTTEVFSISYLRLVITMETQNSKWLRMTRNNSWLRLIHWSCQIVMNYFSGLSEFRYFSQIISSDHTGCVLFLFSVYIYVFQYITVRSDKNCFLSPNCRQYILLIGVVEFYQGMHISHLMKHIWSSFKTCHSERPCSPNMVIAWVEPEGC